MTTTILTDEQIESALISAGYVRADFKLTPQALANSRAIEQAVLQSYESQLLRLLVDIRFAAGDDGKRMQDELVEHIKALRKDAERYRFIRDTPWTGNVEIAPVIELQMNAIWDKTIDAAMQEQKT